MKRTFGIEHMIFVWREIPSLAYSFLLVSYLTIIATQCEEPFGRAIVTVLPPDMVVAGPHLPVPILTQ